MKTCLLNKKAVLTNGIDLVILKAHMTMIFLAHPVSKKFSWFDGFNELTFCPFHFDNCSSRAPLKNVDDLVNWVVVGNSFLQWQERCSLSFVQQGHIFCGFRRKAKYCWEKNKGTKIHRMYYFTISYGFEFSDFCLTKCNFSHYRHQFLDNSSLGHHISGLTAFAKSLLALLKCIWVDTGFEPGAAGCEAGMLPLCPPPLGQ